MKTGYIFAIVAAIGYLLYKNTTGSSSSPTACSSCGGSVGVTAVPTPVETVTSDVSCSGGIGLGCADFGYIPTPYIPPPPDQGGPVMCQGPNCLNIPLSAPVNNYIPPVASPQHPVILASNDPTVTNFFMRGTPSATIL